MNTVETLIQLASDLAEGAGDLEVACDIDQAIGSKSPTEMRWSLTNQYPQFKYSDADLALQEAERVLNQIRSKR
ncbi:hypothetical protein QT972_14800 [Microcoleus sp. herbarium7]|uniref:hypothetical protein n=1 Tax=Microcoleus sp. herbarium7 TaxID=3055435 RepID=UPI002FD2905D